MSNQTTQSFFFKTQVQILKYFSFQNKEHALFLRDNLHKKKVTKNICRGQAYTGLLIIHIWLQVYLQKFFWKYTQGFL